MFHQEVDNTLRRCRVSRMLRGCYEEVTRKLRPWNLFFIE